MSAHHFWMKSGTSGRAIDFNHAAVDDKENAHGDRRDAQVQDIRLQPQAKKLPYAHVLKKRFQMRDGGGAVDLQTAAYHARACVDYVLRKAEYAHDDVKGVRQDVDGYERFENPFVQVHHVELVHVVFFYDELDQFVAQHKGQDHPCNGDDRRIRQGSDHGKDAAVPTLRRLTHLRGNVSHLRVDGVVYTGKLSHDPIDQPLFDPVCKPVKQVIHTLFLSRLNRTNPQAAAPIPRR